MDIYTILYSLLIIPAFLYIYLFCQMLQFYFFIILYNKDFLPYIFLPHATKLVHE